MSASALEPPVVLCFSNHDPTGASGMQADIETAASLGCHCAPLITYLGVQDTTGLQDAVPVSTELLLEQARAVLEDLPVRAIKIGFVATTDCAEAIHSLLLDYEQLPVVVDPVNRHLRSQLESDPVLTQALLELVFPLADVITMSDEDSALFCHQADSTEAKAQSILETGCRHLLLRNTKRKARETVNSLFGRHGLIRTSNWQAIDHRSGDAGDTLSAAIASYLGHSLLAEEAIQQGQNFHWHATANGRQLGMGDKIPNRLFWALDDYVRKSSSKNN